MADGHGRSVRQAASPHGPPIGRVARAVGGDERLGDGRPDWLAVGLGGSDSLLDGGGHFGEVLLAGVADPFDIVKCALPVGRALEVGRDELVAAPAGLAQLGEGPVERGGDSR